MKEKIKYSGYHVMIRFVFGTVDRFINNFQGWFVDDVVVGTATVEYVFTPPYYSSSPYANTQIDEPADADAWGYAWEVNGNIYGDAYTKVDIPAAHLCWEGKVWVMGRQRRWVMRI